MAIVFTVSNAGRAALVNAAHDGTGPTRIAAVGYSATAVATDAAATTLPDEIKRVASISGDVVAADTIHVVAEDHSGDAYTVRSVALYLADGTMFGRYGQADPIIAKTAASTGLIAIDIKFADIAAAQLVFGNTNFLNPPATTERQGVVELATVAEGKAGADTGRAVTPAVARASIVDWLGFMPVQQGGGAYQYANKVAIGFDRDVVAIRAQVDNVDLGPLVTYPRMLERSLPIDAASLKRAGNTVWDAGNDGAGSGSDADLLDGREGAWYADVPNRLGFMPVQQGGGAYQYSNKVAIGFDRDVVAIRVQVDNVDLGPLVTYPRMLERSLPIDAASLKRGGNTVWDAGNDGAGSGADADLLDGREGAWYADVVGRLGFMPVRQGVGTYQLANAVSVGWDGSKVRVQVDASDLGPLATEWNLANRTMAIDAASLKRGGNTVWDAANDGAGSGADADLLDGREGAWYADIVARLGFMPVRQGGGNYQLANVIYLGWDGSKVRVQVDGVDQGPIATEANLANATIPINASSLKRAGNTVWDAANDGAGSGSDSDMLDGYHASAFLLRSDVETSATGNGWVRLPGGLIMQWGRAATSSGNKVTVVFPIAFPNACFTVQATNELGGSSAPTSWPGIGRTDRSGCDIISAQSSGAAVDGVGVKWFAIGN